MIRIRKTLKFLCLIGLLFIVGVWAGTCLPSNMVY